MRLARDLALVSYPLLPPPYCRARYATTGQRGRVSLTEYEPPGAAQADRRYGIALDRASGKIAGLAPNVRAPGGPGAFIAADSQSRKFAPSKD